MNTINKESELADSIVRDILKDVAGRRGWRQEYHTGKAVAYGYSKEKLL